MLCRSCQELQSRSRRKKPSRQSPAAGRDQLCSRCGHLLSPEDMVQRVAAKQSQLARFGLGTTRRPILERKPPRRER